ncbi:MAG TPA: glycoside hydrolase family 3 C-terminal domain-containing protein, partial [Clostridiales bacterium]|nr:glycoside hydrolase family 3 C-terminal domain-containing protein [Clostridiales bacterium]
KVANSGLSQEENRAEGAATVTPGMPELARRAGAEACVLLKNDGVLPLKTNESVAVFGRCQQDWFYVGYGSGGDVHPPYTVNFMEGLKNVGASYDRNLEQIYNEWTHSEEHAAHHGFWGHWPMSHPEMPVKRDLLSGAAAGNETAIVIIGRAAGEDRDSTLTPGSYYLTAEEDKLLQNVSAAFRKTVVVLNIGNLIDFSWVGKYKLDAVLIAWQGGMESGNAVADVLYGNVSPCGKLSDTIARNYEDYPGSAHFGDKLRNEYQEGIFLGYRYFEKYRKDQILYPLGYGLSYTSFDVTPVGLAYNEAENKITMQVRITNTGSCAGKEVIKLWCLPPEGRLQKPQRVLVGFGKTQCLEPGGRQNLLVSAKMDYMASYDESKHAFLYEKGEYRFMVNETQYGAIFMKEETIQEQCTEAAVGGVNLRSRIEKNLPEELPERVVKTSRLTDVKSGRVPMRQFVAELNKEELEALTRGHGFMNSPLGAAGNAGTLGGIIPSLREKGVPVITVTDGPAGIRLKRFSSLLPCGTALACTWNLDLVTDLYELLGQEMVSAGSDLLLAPGMNLHRNPLCGRNFEYFSEDPLLSGFMAAAVIRGIQRNGVSACPKHFCCNNQEQNRAENDSVVGERALRELYLRNFEIAVKEGKPYCLMTSYNKINGVWAHYNYDLVTTILRKEWGYDGLVITDWWMKPSRSPEFPMLRNNAYRVRAGVDVLMPGDKNRLAKSYRTDHSLLETLGKHGGITKGELQEAAGHILRFLLQLMH